jgi:uncharacterized protein YndB with AHSA1/START domain
MGVAHKVESTLILRRVYEKPVERLWRAWTDAKELGQWYVAGDDHVVHFAEADVRVGGTYRVGFGPAGSKPYIETGTYREIVPQKKLVFTEGVAREGEGQLFSQHTIVEFRDLGGSRTEVVVTCTGVDTWRTGEGWTPCLESLARHLGEGR